MKILIISGSPRKGETHKAAQFVDEKLKKIGGFEVDWLILKDLNIKPCIGCFACLNKGENKCPMKDDRDIIVDKMKQADGLIIAVPNYSLQVPALTKNLLDRLAYIFHRPSMQGKIFMGLVTQGVYGGGNILKYLNEAMRFWGFSISKGVSVTVVPGFRLPQVQKKIEAALEKAAGRFAKALKEKKVTVPSLKEVAIFRLARTGMKNMDKTSVDRQYYESKGWFTSKYYYDVRLGPFKSLVGWLMDRFAQHMADKSKRELEAYQHKNVTESKVL
ncbi:MAG: flavodoxin family protein [Clostridia bacterium]|nr:flavodoxin family protein [Clostridia bacterium]